MRRLLLFISLASTALTFGQNQSATDLATELLNGFEQTKTIHQLIKNHKTIKEQLKDIRQWTLNHSIDSNTYNELKHAYTAYTGYMNASTSQLAAQLQGIESTKDFKGNRINRLLNRFQNAGEDQLQLAQSTYTEQFLPAYADAATQAQGKAGIIPAIIAIFNVGKSIFNSIKDLLKGKDWGSQVDDVMIHIAMDMVVNKLQDQLLYPSWDSQVPAYTGQEATFGYSNLGTSYTSAGQRRSEANLTTNTDAYVALTSFGSNQPIPLLLATKNIAVGTDMASARPITTYTTEKMLEAGDRFWVRLQGYAHASFFYFDHDSSSWQDPFGKSIIVGAQMERGIETATYLPSQNQYFEIVGSSPYEQFLILVSDQPLSQQARAQIIGATASGDSILSHLASLPIAVQTIHTAHDSAFAQEAINEVAISTQRAAYEVIPVYIQIAKKH